MPRALGGPFQSKHKHFLFTFLFAQVEKAVRQGHAPHKWQSQSPNSSWWQKVSLMSLMAFAFHTS